MKNYLKSYSFVMKWQILSLKPVLPMAFIFQLLVGIAIVFGLGFMYPQVDALSAKYIVTGAAILALVTLGLVMVPQTIAQMKENKTFDYLWSLPIPRFVFLISDFSIWAIIVLPGVALTLVMGSLHYGFTLTISPLIIPAFLLVALTAVAVGMSIAHLSPSPVLTGILANIIVFMIFFFSPINFPAERLPDWLHSIHKVLPIMYMADLVRGTVTEGLAGNLNKAFVVVSLWCLVSFGSLYMVFSRRG